MGRPSKYSVELRERAARMVAEVRPDHDSEYQAISHVAKLLGVGSPETVRQWIRRVQVDTGARAGVTSEAQEEIKRLKRENAERRPYSAIARLPAINDRFRQDANADAPKVAPAAPMSRLLSLAPNSPLISQVPRRSAPPPLLS